MIRGDGVRRIIDGGVPLLPASVARLLPESLLTEIPLRARGAVNELHLRADSNAWLTCGKENVSLATVFSRRQIEDVFLAVCGGSLYAHADTVREGFVSLGDGVRVGIAGRAVREGERTVGIRDVSALCFRIPTNAWVDPAPLLALLERFSYVRGLLLFSPPGGGKTTALRSLVRALGSGEHPRRVAVVDTRCELAPFLSSRGLCVDILSGYPRREGIEIAVRSMGAQVVVCDEICGADDAKTILELHGGGVPLIATAHAADRERLLSRADLALLHRAGTFGAYVDVNWRRETVFHVTLWDKIEEAVP